MNVLVTGCSGYIGGVLSRKLSSRGHRVIGVDRRPYEGQSVDTFVHGDLCDHSVASDSVVDAEAVFHLAASRTDWGVSEEEYFRDNVRATRTLLEAGTEHDVQRWFFYSSVAAMGTEADPPDESAELRPQGPYGRSKAEAESLFRRLTKEDGEQEVVILRPSAVYGPPDPGDTNVFRLIDAIYRHRFVMVGDGDTRKTTSYIENVVAATLFLSKRMSSGVETFIYVDEPVLKTGELVQRIYELLGRDGPHLRVPQNLAAMVGRVLGVAGDLFFVDIPITGDRIEKFCRETYFDGSALRREGFEQPVDNRTALQRTVEWYLEEIAP